MKNTHSTLARFWLAAMLGLLGVRSYAQPYNALELLSDQSLHKNTIFEQLRSKAPQECVECGEWVALQVHAALLDHDFSLADSLFHFYDERCPETKSISAIYFKGVNEFVRSNYREAISHFKNVRDHLGKMEELYRPLIDLNLGSAYNSLSMLDSAISFYDAAYEGYGDREPALVLNNIASVKIKQGKYADAKHYLEMALQKLKPEEHDVSRLVDINRLQVELELGNRNEAAVLFAILDNNQLPAGNEMQALRTLLGYCIVVDDTAMYYTLSRRFYEVFQYGQTVTDSLLVEIHKSISLNSTFLPILWRLGKEAELKTMNNAQPLNRSSRVDRSVSENYRRLRVTNTVLIGIVLGGIIILIVMLLRKRSSDRMLKGLIDEARDKLSPDTNVQVIRSALEGRGSAKHAINALLQMDYALSLQNVSASQERNIPWDQLDSTETEVLKLLINKKSAKEISQFMNCSVGHVYNVKSKLRRKLNLPDESKALEKWIAQVPRL